MVAFQRVGRKNLQGLSYIYVLAAITEMLTQNIFTASETEKIQLSYHKFRRITIIFLIAGLAIDIGISFVASLNIRSLLLPLLISSILLTLAAFYFVFYKNLKNFKKDLAEQIKLSGKLNVISKSNEKKHYSITFDSEELKSIAVNENVFNKIIPGDVLNTEFGKHSHYIFKLYKHDELLINNS